jgi:spermidine/putrescine transport system substrate-binding protein
MDNWAIAKGAKNIDAAYAFIDYVLRPEVSLAELSYNGYHTGVKDIQDSAEKEGFERLDLVFMTDEQLSKLTAMTVNDAQQRIVDIFSAMKAKAGA